MVQFSKKKLGLAEENEVFFGAKSRERRSFYKKEKRLSLTLLLVDGERPFVARKNGPFSRFITDEKSISHETQRGSFALALIKWVDEESFCPKPLSFG